MSGLGFSKSYRLFEDPLKGPGALENWKIPLRISGKEWFSLVRIKGSTPYVVQLGDTLSKISKKELGDEDYWPKLWEVNKEQISNPHLIEPSQALFFIHPNQIERQIANQKEETGKIKASAEDLPDQLLREDLFQSHRLRYFVLEGQKVAGVITGSYEKKSVLDLNSSVYVGISDKDQIKTGQSFAVVREVVEGNLPEGLTKKFGSNLMRLMGEVKIESVHKDFAIASIEATYDLLERGDRLLLIPTVNMKEKDLDPPSSLVLKILLGENLESKMISEGQLILLDQGTRQGVKPGYIFGVYEDTDPHFDKSDLVMPRSKGEVKIVQAGDSWSTGYVRSVSGPIEGGDVLIAGAIFEKKSKISIQGRRPTLIE